MSSMNVVDVKSEEKGKSEEIEKDIESVSNELTGEDLLWVEILKTLDKFEKGVEGDLSALGRATRNINRFRKRLPSTTWLRILHTVIPKKYKNEFRELLKIFIVDINDEEIKLISNLAGVALDAATKKLQENNGDVFGALMVIIAEKEEMAKNEIKKKQEQLKKERLEREEKKGSNATKKDDKMEVDSSEKDESAMDVDSEPEKEKKDDDKKEKAEDIKISLIPLKDREKKRKFYPETYIFLQLLISLELYDRNIYKLSLEILERLILFTKQQNRRTSDLLSSRLYQFYVVCTQREKKELISIKSFLFDHYQTACLQQNEAAQSALIVLILQCYISANLYSLGHKFVEKAEFPESAESQYFARYHYYRGCIDCVQLNYSNSLYHLEQAIRRCPQTGAYGFKINATRWLIVIQLLMGDIPDRNIFKPRFDGDNNRNNPVLNEALAPFLEITECVKEGQLKKFTETIKKYEKLFIQCKIYKILLRLRHNVIKTGLRKINKSYSKISLKDIANKLGLSSDKNAYFIVSKAIRDGVINAKIDYNKKYVESNENVDIYKTSQPYSNYSQRIKFCLEIRNNAVKSLRYPPNDDEDEKKEKKAKNDDDFVTPEEIAEIVRRHFEEEDED